MADRVVVGNPFENQIGTVAPTASPVDTYVRPVVEKSPFESLASTLANLERKATPALARQEERMAKKEFAEGQRLYEENRIAIGEAVKKGIIAEGESPYVRKGYRVSQMNTMAARYADDLERALETKKLYHSGDPKKIEEFIKTFQADFVKNNGMDGFTDSELSTYFGQPTAKVNEAFRASWQKKHVAYAAAQAYKAFEAEAAQYLALSFHAGMTEDEYATAIGGVKTYLESRAAQMATDGLDNGKVIDTILDAVGIAVEKTGNTDIINVLANTKIGTDFVSKTLKGQAKLLDIQGKALTIQNARRVAEEREEEARQNNFRTEGNAALFKVLQEPTQENMEAARKVAADMVAMGDATTSAAANTMLVTMDKILGDQAEAKASDPQSLIDYERAVRNAATEEDAWAIARDFASRGTIKRSDLIGPIDTWRRDYDRSKHDVFSLDFRTSSTAEGSWKNKLENLYQRDSFGGFDIIQMNKANLAGGKFERQLRDQVAIFTHNNKGRKPYPSEVAEMAEALYEKLSAALLKEYE